MHGEILEIVCDRVRDAAAALKEADIGLEVQTFGDRLHVIVADPSAGTREVGRILDARRIRIGGIRAIPPSLENVFISLLTHSESPKDAV